MGENKQQYDNRENTRKYGKNRATVWQQPGSNMAKILQKQWEEATIWQRYRKNCGKKQQYGKHIAKIKHGNLADAYFER